MSSLADFLEGALQAPFKLLMTTPILERAFANLNVVLHIPNMGCILPLKVESHPVCYEVACVMSYHCDQTWLFKKQKEIGQSRN